MAKIALSTLSPYRITLSYNIVNCIISLVYSFLLAYLLSAETRGELALLNNSVTISLFLSAIIQGGFEILYAQHPRSRVFILVVNAVAGLILSLIFSIATQSAFLQKHLLGDSSKLSVGFTYILLFGICCLNGYTRCFTAIGKLEWYSCAEVKFNSLQVFFLILVVYYNLLDVEFLLFVQCLTLVLRIFTYSIYLYYKSIHNLPQCEKTFDYSFSSSVLKIGPKALVYGLFETILLRLPLTVGYSFFGLAFVATLKVAYSIFDLLCFIPRIMTSILRSRILINKFQYNEINYILIFLTIFNLLVLAIWICFAESFIFHIFDTKYNGLYSIGIHLIIAAYFWSISITCLGKLNIDNVYSLKNLKGILVGCCVLFISFFIIHGIGDSKFFAIAVSISYFFVGTLNYLNLGNLDKKST